MLALAQKLNGPRVFTVRFCRQLIPISWPRDAIPTVSLPRHIFTSVDAASASASMLLHDINDDTECACEKDARHAQAYINVARARAQPS